MPVFPHATSVVGASGSGATGSGESVATAAAGQLFLDRLREVWDDHIACMSKIRDVLKYLVRRPVFHFRASLEQQLTLLPRAQDKHWQSSSSAAVPSVFDLGLSLFFHHVILFSTKPKPAVAATSSRSSAAAAAIPPSQRPTADPSTVAHHLIHTLLTVIRIEREGEVVSRSAIHSAVDILSRLTDEGAVPLPIQASAGTGSGSPVVSSSSAAARARTVMGEGPPGAQESPYKTAFEQALLKQTEEFYSRESARLLVECDCPSFLQRVRPSFPSLAPAPAGETSIG